MTDKIYSLDAYAAATDAVVVEVDEDDKRILLDRTVFYPGGGGQPFDTGHVRLGDDWLRVVRVTEDASGVWHWLEGGLPVAGSRVRGEVDWVRRLLLMRTHTAMHALCGVMWRRFKAPVTGGNMKPGEGRLDFELPTWDPEDKIPIERALNHELAKALPVRISFLSRAEADRDPSLIRTKVNLLPSDLREVRVVDIVDLDRQADAGTHVNSTREVGRVAIRKIESKGKGFRRVRLGLITD